MNFNKNWIYVVGPCAAESKKQIFISAKKLKKHGVHIFRAGIWKPRTNSNAWQGIGDRAVEWLVEVKKKVGIKIATEVKDKRTLNLALKANFDLVWVGSRNGQNYAFLHEVGLMTKKTKTPVIVKRAMATSLNEWIGAAGYVARNNSNIILCERGIRGYAPDTRNILDLQGAYLAKINTKYPVIVDVSHAAGRRDLILPMSKAVKACGFNGLMVEVHPQPDLAKTDGFQQINFRKFSQLISALKKLK